MENCIKIPKNWIQVKKSIQNKNQRIKQPSLKLLAMPNS